MRVTWAHGVRVGALTVDPVGRAPIALWTHRVRRRPLARLTIASAPLADTWRDVQGLPLGVGAVAAGQRLELLPTGYGPGGAAALLSDEGLRTLVVGPTTEALCPREAEEMVIAAPAAPTAPPDWLERLDLERPTRLVVPDGGAVMAACAALDAAGVPHRRPEWLPGGHRDAPLWVTTAPPGRALDLRPQASLAWLSQYAQDCGARLVYVHGPRSDALVRALTAAGVPARVIQAPAQLVLAGLSAHERHEQPPTDGPVAPPPALDD